MSNYISLLFLQGPGPSLCPGQLTCFWAGHRWMENSPATYWEDRYHYDTHTHTTQWSSSVRIRTVVSFSLLLPVRPTAAGQEGTRHRTPPRLVVTDRTTRSDAPPLTLACVATATLKDEMNTGEDNEWISLRHPLGCSYLLLWVFFLLLVTAHVCFQCVLRVCVCVCRWVSLGSCSHVSRSVCSHTGW